MLTGKREGEMPLFPPSSEFPFLQPALVPGTKISLLSHKTHSCIQGFFWKDNLAAFGFLLVSDWQFWTNAKKPPISCCLVMRVVFAVI